MPRLALATAFLLAVPAILAQAALAQAVTRPVVSVSAGVMRGVFDVVSVSPDGRDVTSDARTFYAVGVGGEVPVVSRGELTASAGAMGCAASDVFGGGFRPQSVTLYARLGTAGASGLLGVALDVGSGFFGSGFSSDGQTAVVAQLSAGRQAGRVRLFGQLDGALALPTDEEILVNSLDDLDGRPYAVRVNAGHQGSVRVGASVPAGPVELGSRYSPRVGRRGRTGSPATCRRPSRPAVGRSWCRARPRFSSAIPGRSALSRR